MSVGNSQSCPECGDPYIGGPGCYAGACGAEPDVSYAAYLVAKLGRPMKRALIRARHRYTAAHPDRPRLRRMHAAYRRRSRRG